MLIVGIVGFIPERQTLKEGTQWQVKQTIRIVLTLKNMTVSGL